MSLILSPGEGVSVIRSFTSDIFFPAVAESLVEVNTCLSKFMYVEELAAGQ